MAEAIKIADDELKKFTDLQEAYAKKTTELGQISVNKHILEKQMEVVKTMEDKAKSDYTELLKQEEELRKEFATKYGNGSLDIKNGTFTPFN